MARNIHAAKAWRAGRLLGWVFTLGLGALLGAGCASEKQEASPVLASVEVRDGAPGRIATTAIAVFIDHGYEVSTHTKHDLTFDKPASSWNRFAYGGWTSASAVWERVHMALVPEGETQTRLECDAYLISSRGEPVEERLKYGRVDRKPLQQMLDEIAARLNQPPAEPAPGSEPKD